MAHAQESSQELSRRIDQLAQQVNDLSLGETGNKGDLQSMHGLGPAASNVYAIDQGVSIGGYGEMLFTGESGANDQLDFYRAITYIGYRFNEDWLFNSEIEWEHVNETAVEFAYLDWIGGTETLNTRVGHLLVPSGFINEMHEPTTFWSANRPEMERQIMPSTWHANGAGIWGDISDTLSYRVYLMEGLDAPHDGTDYDAMNSGLRDWRQKGSKAIANSPAVAARMDWDTGTGLMIGASMFSGNSGQDEAVTNREDLATSITDVHAQFDSGPLRIRGLWASGSIGRDSGVDEEIGGWYLEAGYDLFAGSSSSSSLTPFIRTGAYDLDSDDTATGSEIDNLTIGVAWQPIDEIIFKVNSTANSFADGSDDEDILGVSVGYVF